jgi:hypothetical protein
MRRPPRAHQLAVLKLDAHAGVAGEAERATYGQRAFRIAGMGDGIFVGDVERMVVVDRVVLRGEIDRRANVLVEIAAEDRGRRVRNDILVLTVRLFN